MSDTKPVPALLMTRPKAGSMRFLDLLPADLLRGVHIVHCPLLDIVPMSGPLALDGISSVIFTSGEGVRIASAKTAARLRAFCVGARTAEAARAAGWDAICVGETADEVVAALREKRPKGAIVHLHGEHTRGAIAERLVSDGLDCHGQTLYRQELLPLTHEAKQVLRTQRPVLVPLFSPRTAAHFASLCPDGAHLSLIAMSEAVVRALPRLQTLPLHVSKAPTAQAMAEMLRDVAWPLVRVETDRPED